MFFLLPVWAVHVHCTPLGQNISETLHRKCLYHGGLSITHYQYFLILIPSGALSAIGFSNCLFPNSFNAMWIVVSIFNYESSFSSTHFICVGISGRTLMILKMHKSLSCLPDLNPVYSIFWFCTAYYILQILVSI